MFSGQIIDESCHWRTQAKRYQETSLFCGPNFSLPLLLYFFFFSFSIERPTPIIYYQDLDTYSYTKIVNSFFKSQSITHLKTTWNSLSDVLLDQKKESKDKFVKKCLSEDHCHFLDVKHLVKHHSMTLFCYRIRESRRKSMYLMIIQVILSSHKNKVLVHNWQQYFSEENILIQDNTSNNISWQSLLSSLFSVWSLPSGRNQFHSYDHTFLCCLFSLHQDCSSWKWAGREKRKEERKNIRRR